MSEKTLLTIGMPVYNEEKHIAEAIESLLAQTYKDFIFIISDNASTDKTQEICESYAKKDKRIIYIRQPENKGGSFNFFYVLGRAETPFFMSCGGHDKWHPHFIEKLLPALKENGVVLSCPLSQVIKFNGELGEVGKGDCTTTNINKPADRYLYFLSHARLHHLFLGIWSTKVFKGLNFDFKSFASDVLVLEQASFEGKFKQCNEVLFWLRQNRKPEACDDGIKRQFYDVYGIKKSEFWLAILYVWESIKIPLNKRYSLGINTRLWLVLNVIYYKFFKWCIPTILKITLKKIIGQKNYYKLKSIKDS